MDKRYGNASVNNNPRGLPLTESHFEQRFLKLTAAQIGRIEEHGYMRPVERGEGLVEQGDSNVPFFVVVSGEIEILRPSGAIETLITAHDSGEITGEVNILSGRRVHFRARMTKPSKVIEMDRQHSRIEDSKIVLRTHADIVNLEGGIHLESVQWRNSKTRKTEEHRISNVFIMGGADPNTPWLNGCVGFDSKGFIKT